MTYAGDRVISDADSHLMELPDWLGEFAEPDVGDRLRPLAASPGKAGGKLAEDAVRTGEARRAAGAEVAEQELRDELLELKGWHAIGAFDPAERSRALDELASPRRWCSPPSPRPSTAAVTGSWWCAGRGPTTGPWPPSAPTSPACWLSGDPIGRFESNLGDLPARARDRFYAGNFAQLVGLPGPAANG